MADKKISQLTSATTLTGAELVPVVQAGATVRTTVTDFGGAVGYTPAGTGAVATTVQTKLRESVSVKDFGAVGDGVTDDSAAFANAIAYLNLAGGGTLDVPYAQYSVGTTGVAISYYNIHIEGNGSTILYYGSGHGLDAVLVGTIYPQGVTVSNIAVSCFNSCSSAIRTRFSYSIFNNVTADIRASNTVGWRIDTDFVSGTGPYYNQFINCHSLGKVGITGGVANQTGWLFTTDVSAPTRGPNANTFLPGRTANMTNAWVIAGAQNRIIGPTIENTVSGGQIITFENVYGAGAGCINNEVVYPYVESASGANFLKFGTNSNYNHVERPYTTSLGAGTYLNDASGNLTNTMVDFSGYRFNLSNPSSDPRTLDWYEEGTFTPVLAGSTTPGTQTYSIQTGRFQRVGNRVHVQITILLTARDAATAGNLKVTGLPYTAKASTNSYAILAAEGKLTLTAGYSWWNGRIDPGQNFVYINQSGTGVDVLNVPGSALLATTEVMLSGSYEV